jgi:hypothetical protein
MNRYARLFLVAALMASACQSTRHPADNLPSRQLRFGYGGGFSGKEQAYTLLENGQLFFVEPGSAPKVLPDVKPKKAAELFRQAEQVFASEPSLLSGNTYAFIELNAGNRTQRLAWNDQKANPVQDVQGLYANLMQQVRQ